MSFINLDEKNLEYKVTRCMKFRIIQNTKRYETGCANLFKESFIKNA